MVWSRKLGPGVGALSLAASRKSVKSAPLWSVPFLRETPSPQHPSFSYDQPDRQGAFFFVTRNPQPFSPAMTLDLVAEEVWSQSSQVLKFLTEQLGKVG